MLILQTRKQRCASSSNSHITLGKKHQGALFPSCNYFMRTSFSMSVEIKFGFMLNLIVYSKEFITEPQRITCFYLIRFPSFTRVYFTLKAKGKYCLIFLEKFIWVGYTDRAGVEIQMILDSSAPFPQIFIRFSIQFNKCYSSTYVSDIGNTILSWQTWPLALMEFSILSGRWWLNK